MKKYASILTAMLVLSIFSGMAAGGLPVIAAEETAMSAQSPAGDQPENFTKLEISPRYGNVRLQAGENKELTVTIKNKEKKAISVKPDVVIPPYGEYMMEKEWITITPDSVEIPEGASQKFTIKTSIPKDASRGYYNAQIAFTDDVMPNPYPMPFPNYINTFQLSVDVWAPFKIQIMTQYISDQLEAGGEYDYEIKLKNTADQAIGINPKLGSEPSYGGPFGMTTPSLTEDAITITSPKSIPAGATEIVKIHVKVPEDAKGYFNGYIDLGIDDMSVRDWEGRVSINFNIWKQPTEPFIKSFTLNKEAPITIEVSSAQNYGYPYGKSGGSKAHEPLFETTLIGPDGKQVDLTVTKTVTKGNVNMGGERPPWEIDSESIYQENGIQRIETYKAKGSATGEWKLKVLPRNTQGFDYSIIIGE
ncbi:MAG: hypothetical protein FIB08_02320 [Candidatus Methanoperedens sp.]|nr:hypothetical protein [Candidatus Methanoperedens sp.]